MIVDTNPMIVRRCLQPKSGGEYKIVSMKVDKGHQTLDRAQAVSKWQTTSLARIPLRLMLNNPHAISRGRLIFSSRSLPYRLIGGLGGRRSVHGNPSACCAFLGAVPKLLDDQ